jgi:hypothetical protein
MSVSATDRSTAKPRQRRGLRRQSKPKASRTVRTVTTEKSISPWIYLVRVAICVLGMSAIVGTVTAIVKPAKPPAATKAHLPMIQYFG